MTDVVVASGLVRQFSSGGIVVRAVDGADITVAAGELVMVLGRSGAGKTTLLSLVGGLDRPDSGTVSVAGEVVEALTGRQRDRFLQRSVGWVFQTSGLIPLLTAQENVQLSLRLAGVDDADLEDRAVEALARVGLRARRFHTAAELSGGEQQRVALARALAKRPPLVIADEPTAQLDSETAGGIMVLLREVSSAGTAVLMATHDRVAVEFADRVVGMEDGRLTAAPTPAPSPPGVART
ncbi:MAG: ABC transporter ATP-binding protein [Candidatus Dormibacteraeota bacterium]|uniref:ABC transporter ATP-binding protein n=1 Tax=Candidatus Amunia macphersoniae TaxID=3127014 RepID=A0A934KBU2_9BACT|nr:ABC transporter ATP-binding protein [Candidatus Dormibacteraeota bacterium]